MKGCCAVTESAVPWSCKGPCQGLPSAGTAEGCVQRVSGGIYIYLSCCDCVQGVDWRDKQNWGCNAGMNPYLEYMNDGISLVWTWHVYAVTSTHATADALLLVRLDSFGENGTERQGLTVENFVCTQDPLEVVFVKMKAHYLDLGAHPAYHPYS